MSRSMLVVLAFVLCVFATAMIRGGPLELPGIGAGIAITLVWIVGVTCIIRTVTKKKSN